MPEQQLVWGIILLGAALAVFVLEVFVPSMGLLSIVGVGLAIVGLVMLFQYDVMTGVIGLLVMLVLGPLVFTFALKVFPHTAVGRSILYGGKSEEEIERETAERQSEADKRLALVGMEGQTLTPLRPVGAVRIEGQRYDAVSELGMVEAGVRVRVTAADGTQIKVRPV
ncbi:MAG: hypothetical protein KDA05_12725 [Phycisphaerales bacterium]|nr:hypothetical protein [Phycisphaerales bacterium]MCB9841131.1 hypothetical protein [Phycisphaeraceae bacterium]